jgi:hypothetical protein
MLIKNYGLFWDRERVHWGWNNNPGSIQGFLHQDKKTNIEFRDQQGIYALYDAAFNLIYVGQAGSGKLKLLKRLKQHRTDHLSQRWKYFSWFGLCQVLKSGKLSKPDDGAQLSSSVALNQLEAIAIAISEPRLNLQRGRWDKCEQYYQHKTMPHRKKGEEGNWFSHI